MKFRKNIFLCPYYAFNIVQFTPEKKSVIITPSLIMTGQFGQQKLSIMTRWGVHIRLLIIFKIKSKYIFRPVVHITQKLSTLPHCPHYPKKCPHYPKIVHFNQKLSTLPVVHITQKSVQITQKLPTSTKSCLNNTL